MTFQVIYADPAWKFRVYSSKGHGRSAEHHYPTMEDETLLNLRVSNVAAKDCALFMWATCPTLPLALQVGAAWGFEYKTIAFTWVKTTPRTWGKFVHLSDRANWHTGMGYWTRANTELCLLFTRGKPKRKSKSISQVLIAPTNGHSRKPHETYERIEALIDAPMPYLELFARNTREGWVSLGNEIDGQDLKYAIENIADKVNEL